MATPRILALFAGLTRTKAGRRASPARNQGMTPKTPPAPPPAGACRSVPVRDTLLDSDYLALLSEDEAIRIAAAMDAAYAETTRTVCAFAWDRWVRWCADRRIASFPADPAAVCAYLTRCAEQGLTLASVDSACSAIGHQHRCHGATRPDRAPRGPPGPPRAAAYAGPRTSAPCPPPQRRGPAPDQHRHRPQHRARRPRHRHPADRVPRRAASLRARRAHPGGPRAQTRRTPEPPAPLQDRPGRVRSRRRRRARLPPAHGSGPLAGAACSGPRTGVHQPSRPEALSHPDLRERRLQRRQGTRHHRRPRR